MRFRLIFRSLACLLIIFLILIGCAKKVNSVNVNETPLEVEVTKAKRYKIVPQFLSFGNISFKSKTDISSAVSGVVRHISVDIGDRVTPGEILASVENIQLTIEEKRVQAEIQSAEAALSLANAKLYEGKLQVRARFLNLEKKKLQINQKKSELKELNRIIKNKEELLKIDGITLEKLNQLKLEYQSGVAAYNMLLKDYEIESIGLTDKDLADSFEPAADLYSAARTKGFGHGGTGISPADRQEKLVLLNTRTLQAEVRVAKAKLETAKTKLYSVRTLLEELKIKSDFNGIVGARYVEEGERIKEGTKLFTTFNSSTVYAVFPVQEGKAGLLSRGQRVKITVPALQDMVYNGTIDIISPTIDSRSGNISIKALMTNKSEKMLPGMFVKVAVDTGNPVMKLLIPVSAIVRKQGDNARIFTIVNNRAFLKKIMVGSGTLTDLGSEVAVENNVDKVIVPTENSDEPGIDTDSDGKVEVIKGLREGEVVIVKPPPVLKEGMLVEWGAE